MRMTPISAVASSVVVALLPGWMLSTGHGLASATAAACSGVRPARAKACCAPRAVATARTYRAPADVSVSEMGFCTRILPPPSTTMSRLPALNAARAALRSGSRTSSYGQSHGRGQLLQLGVEGGRAGDDAHLLARECCWCGRWG